MSHVYCNYMPRHRLKHQVDEMEAFLKHSKGRSFQDATTKNGSSATEKNKADASAMKRRIVSTHVGIFNKGKISRMVKRPSDGTRAVPSQHFSEDAFYGYADAGTGLGPTGGEHELCLEGKENSPLKGHSKRADSAATLAKRQPLSTLMLTDEEHGSGRVPRSPPSGRRHSSVPPQALTATPREARPPCAPVQRPLRKEGTIERVPKSLVIDLLANAYASGDLRAVPIRSAQGRTGTTSLSPPEDLRPSRRPKPLPLQTPASHDIPGPAAVPLVRVIGEVLNDDVLKQFTDCTASVLRNASSVKFEGLRVWGSDRTTPRSGSSSTAPHTSYEEGLLRNLRCMADLKIPSDLRVPEMSSVTPSGGAEVTTPQQTPSRDQPPPKKRSAEVMTMATGLPGTESSANSEGMQASQTVSVNGGRADIACPFPEASESAERLMERIKRRRLASGDVVPIARGDSGCKPMSGCLEEPLCATQASAVRDHDRHFPGFDPLEAFEREPSDMVLDDAWVSGELARSGYDEPMAWTELPHDDVGWQAARQHAVGMPFPGELQADAPPADDPFFSSAPFHPSSTWVPTAMAEPQRPKMLPHRMF